MQFILWICYLLWKTARNFATSQTQYWFIKHLQATAIELYDKETNVYKPIKFFSLKVSLLFNNLIVHLVVYYALVIGFPEGSTPGLTTGCCGRIHVDCNKILPQSRENHNTLFYHLKRGWGNCFFEFYPREYDGKFFKGNIFQICRKLRNCDAWGG